MKFPSIKFTNPAHVDIDETEGMGYCILPEVRIVVPLHYGVRATRVALRGLVRAHRALVESITTTLLGE